MYPYSIYSGVWPLPKPPGHCRHRCPQLPTNGRPLPLRCSPPQWPGGASTWAQQGGSIIQWLQHTDQTPHGKTMESHGRRTTFIHDLHGGFRIKSWFAESSTFWVGWSMLITWESNLIIRRLQITLTCIATINPGWHFCFGTGLLKLGSYWFWSRSQLTATRANLVQHLPPK